METWRENGAKIMVGTGADEVRNPEYVAILRRQRRYTREVEVYLQKNKLEAGNKNAVTAVDIADSTLKVLRKMLLVLREMRDVSCYSVSS